MKKHEFQIADGGLRSENTSLRARLRNPKSAIRNTRGFTLLEIIIVITILSVLTAAAIPMVRNSVKRERESELRLALRQLRQAIDRYQDFASKNPSLIPIELNPKPPYYPPDLKTLVEGFVPRGVVSETRVRFIRRIPIDPMTGTADWGLRSYKDKTDSTSWGTEDVFDVYSKSNGEAMNGTMYKDW